MILLSPVFCKVQLDVSHSCSFLVPQKEDLHYKAPFRFVSITDCSKVWFQFHRFGGHGRRHRCWNSEVRYVCQCFSNNLAVVCFHETIIYSFLSLFSLFSVKQKSISSRAVAWRWDWDLQDQRIKKPSTAWYYMIFFYWLEQKCIFCSILKASRNYRKLYSPLNLETSFNRW